MRPTAFDRELVEHVPFLRRYAIGNLGLSWNDADDAVSATAVKALERWQAFRNEGHGMRPWLTVVLRNHVVDQARTRGRHGLVTYEERYAGAVPPTGDRRIELGEVLRAMDRLAGDKRRTFLRVLQAPSMAAVAQMEGIPLNTVRTRVHYARAELAAALA